MIRVRRQKESVLRSQRGATAVEYALAAAFIAIAIAAAIGGTEEQVADRVKTGRAAYTCFELEDPRGGSGVCP